jgi:hypothetical protein
MQIAWPAQVLTMVPVLPRQYALPAAIYMPAASTLPTSESTLGLSSFTASRGCTPPVGRDFDAPSVREVGTVVRFTLNSNLKTVLGGPYIRQYRAASG